MRISSGWIGSSGLLVVLALAWLAYLPGLSGGFLLDDYQNLKTLERIEAPLTTQKLASVVLTNPSGEWGRGVAMFSFAVQYSSWPANPAAFKRVNLFIHLINGLLFYGLAVRLLVMAKVPLPRGRLIALMSSALWLLNPMQVSTVLYVVQRMTELSATFMLLGLLAYLAGRQMALQRPWRGYAAMTFGLAFFGILAVLSKENGALLPLFVLVLESTLLRDVSSPPYWRAWKWVMLGVPLLMGAGLLVAKFSSLVLAGYAQRDFTLGERLLTEARALMDYLGSLLLPRLGHFGVFHDDYAVSHSLFDPPQTMGAVLLILSLIISAFILRKRQPFYAFAVLWFFAGHLLESTVFPLELYFEHRNYFPSIGLFLGVAYGVDQVTRAQSSKWMRHFLVVFAIVWSVLLSFLTWNESKSWGDPMVQAFKWSIDSPNSMRANLQLADMKFQNGDVLGAEEIYTSLAVKEPGLTASQMALGCFGKEVPVPTLESAARALRSARFSKYPFGGMEQIVVLKENGGCRNLSPTTVLGLFDALLQNPNFASRQYQYLVMKGRYLAADKDWEKALASFDEAYALNPNVEVALLGVKTLALAGHPEKTGKYLERARKANERNTLSRFTYEKDIEDWERQLKSMQQISH